MEQEQFVAPIEFNFNPENKNEIFGVPMERALQMAEEFDVIVTEIVNDEKKYTVRGTGENEGRNRLDEGAILKRFIGIAKNTNEWAFVVYSANPMYDNIKHVWNRAKHGRNLVEVLASAIRNSI